VHFAEVADIRVAGVTAQLGGREEAQCRVDQADLCAGVRDGQPRLEEWLVVVILASSVAKSEEDR
jgi:hypothetical protein